MEPVLHRGVPKRFCSKRCGQAAYRAANRQQINEKARVRQQEYRRKYPERSKESAERYRATHADKVRAGVRAAKANWRTKDPQHARAVENRAAKRYRDRYPERSREASQAWKIANADKVRMTYRSWREANAERIRRAERLRRQRDPEPFKEKARRRRASKLGAPAIDRDLTLQGLYARDGGRCHICKKHVPWNEKSLDHLIPLSKGGAHTWANSSLAHIRCNSRRGVGRIPAQLRLI